jgi:hypothetical protein
VNLTELPPWCDFFAPFWRSAIAGDAPVHAFA